MSWDSMPKGAMQELFLENVSVTEALNSIANALEAADFRILESKSEDGKGFLKAVWGKKLKSYLVGNLPFGKLFKSGKRLGAEVEAIHQGTGVSARLLVVPYMELFDRPEVFLISQGILEKLTDDSLSRKKLDVVMANLQQPAAPPEPIPQTTQVVHNNPGPAPAPAGPYASYSSPVQPVYSKRSGGGLFWLLGFLVTGAVLFYFFYYSTRAYTSQEVLLIGLGALFAGGFVTRKGMRGALMGFFILFLPLLALGILVLMGTFASAGEAQGLEGIVTIVGAVAGVILIGVAFVAGIIGLIVAGIAGWIGGKIFPINP